MRMYTFQDDRIIIDVSIFVKGREIWTLLIEHTYMCTQSESCMQTHSHKQQSSLMHHLKAMFACT